MKHRSKQRRCPKCSGDTFEHAGCSEGRGKLEGHTLHCLDCGWQGFTLQLVPAPEVKTAAAAAERINEEVLRNAKKGPG